MSNLAVVQMVECEERCGALVRPGMRRCSRCEELVVEFETRRLAQQRVAEAERDRRRSERPAVCEASDFPSILVSVSVRERLMIAGCVVGALGISLGLGTLLFLGAKAAVGWLLKVSA